MQACSLLPSPLTLSAQVCHGRLCWRCASSAQLGFLHAGRAAWENAKDATVDSGRYLAGRASAVVSGDTRDSGGLVSMYNAECSLYHVLSAMCQLVVPISILARADMMGPIAVCLP